MQTHHTQQQFEQLRCRCRTERGRYLSTYLRTVNPFFSYRCRVRDECLREIRITRVESESPSPVFCSDLVFHNDEASVDKKRLRKPEVFSQRYSFLSESIGDVKRTRISSAPLIYYSVCRVSDTGRKRRELHRRQKIPPDPAFQINFPLKSTHTRAGRQCHVTGSCYSDE